MNLIAYWSASGSVTEVLETIPIVFPDLKEIVFTGRLEKLGRKW